MKKFAEHLMNGAVAAIEHEYGTLTRESPFTETWRNLLASFPVAVNNFYGDPLIQWANTQARLADLLEDGHTGPVAIITKGKATEKHAARLREFRDRRLNIVVLVSISELPNHERVGQEHRYRNIAVLKRFGIPVIAYVRPMTPPFNTTPEVIGRITANLRANGADIICLSGFRGDDAIVADMSPEKKIQWTMRVKQLSSGVLDLFRKGCEADGEHPAMRIFLRTSCAVAAALGMDRSYNPYYNSPNLCKCSELDCPLIGTCAPPQEPRAGSIELLQYLGFDVEIQNVGCRQICSVRGENRLACPSCCTTCYMLKNPRVYVRNKGINLGTLAFIRFLTGMQTVQDGLRDSGEKDIGFVRFPNFPEIDDFVCINTWAAYAQHGSKCFECKYCVEKYYRGRNCDTTPVRPLSRFLAAESVMERAA